VIYLVDGVPGAGKTYYACRRIEQDLCAGKVVCTNVALKPDWAWRVAGANPARRMNRSARNNRARELERRLLYSDDLAELFRVRTEGTAEGRAVMVLDEAHRWLNSRSWAGQKGRAEIIAWFTGHRHYGFDVFLITQYVDMVDKQVRNLVEYRVRLRNLKRERFCGVRVIPTNLFAAITELHGGKKDVNVVGRDFYRLQGRVAGMYDTHGLAIADAPADTIWLPRAPAPALAGGGAPMLPEAVDPELPDRTTPVSVVEAVDSEPAPTVIPRRLVAAQEPGGPLSVPAVSRPTHPGR